MRARPRGTGAHAAAARLCHADAASSAGTLAAWHARHARAPPAALAAALAAAASRAAEAPDAARDAVFAAAARLLDGGDPVAAASALADAVAAVLS